MTTFDAFEAIRKAIESGDSASVMLLEMLEGSGPAYASVRRLFATEFGWRRFSADHGSKAIQELDARIERDAAAYCRGVPPEEVLRQTVDCLGTGSESDTFIHSGELSLKKMSRKGIHVFITNDLSRAEFGETRDSYIAGLAYSKINLRTSGHTALRLVLHEYGHALHFHHLKTEFGLLRDSLPRFYTEGIALVVESIADDATWLERYFQATSDQIARLRRLRLARELYRLRESLAFALTENVLAACEQPEDMDELWNAIAFTMLFPDDVPLGIRGFERYHNRLILHGASALQVALSQAIAFAIRCHLLQDDGTTLFSPAFGAGLNKFISNAHHWHDMLSKNLGYSFTGAALGRSVDTLAKGLLL